MKTKNQKGITLIALIITIIVMLILVGVSVSVALNTGLFKTAQEAAKNTQIAAEAETALSNGTINVKGTGEIDIDDYVTSLKGAEGGNVNWELTTDSGETGLSVGDLITHKEKTTEQFYIISVTENKVAMLAAKNITTTEPLEQTDSFNNVPFSSTNYWSSVSGIAYPDANGKYPDLNDETKYPIGDATSIISVAKEYGEALGATGRLMTLEELVNLGGSPDTGEITNCPDFIKNPGWFWLGSAGSENGVWHIYSSGADLRFDEYINPEGSVTPVLEVLTSSIDLAL